MQIGFHELHASVGIDADRSLLNMAVSKIYDSDFPVDIILFEIFIELFGQYVDKAPQPRASRISRSSRY